MKINKIIQTDNAFPQLLRDIPQPPQEIYALGDLTPLLSMPRLAVVGSRKVTPYGRSVTTDLIQAVARLGVVIISGLALGVDAIAHQAALDAGGRTIAVLPCGLDAPYPVRHRPLARNILTQGGALVSEYSNGTPPLQFRFLERNRLVSGLADALLITEATIKSGTLHTANFALEQGKTVMAIPGNITSQLSQGTNSLIRTGAVPITSAEDILQALNINSAVLQREVLPANAAEAAILDLIRTGTTEGSSLQTASQLDAALFSQTLTMLEITGKIRSLGAGHWTIN